MNVEFNDKITEKLTKIAKILNIKKEELVTKIVEKEIKFLETQSDQEIEIFPNTFICRGEILSRKTIK